MQVTPYIVNKCVRNKGILPKDDLGHLAFAFIQKILWIEKQNIKGDPHFITCYCYCYRYYILLVVLLLIHLYVKPGGKIRDFHQGFIYLKRLSKFGEWMIKHIHCFVCDAAFHPCHSLVLKTVFFNPAPTCSIQSRGFKNDYIFMWTLLIWYGNWNSHIHSYHIHWFTCSVVS